MDIPDDIQQFVFLDDTRPDTRPVLWVDENRLTHRRLQSFVSHGHESGMALDVRPVSLTRIHQMQQDGEQHPDTAAQEADTAEQTRVIHLTRDGNKIGASDIHFEVRKPVGKNGKGIAKIFVRVNGDLQIFDSLSETEGMKLVRTIFESMCDSRSESSFSENMPQDARLSPGYLEKAGLFAARYLHIPTIFGLKVVMRLIPHDDGELISLDKQGFLPEQISIIRELNDSPSGMMVTSGPTGSGKSTTMRTVCRMYIASTRGTKCLLTVEDPVEGNIEGAVQCSMTTDQWERFHSASVRADPDAMMVGEVRDTRSAHTAVITAQAGHPTYSTTHTDDPFGILDRFGSFGIEDDLLYNPRVFSCLISQRLVQRLCPHCCLTWEEAEKILTPEQCARVRQYFPDVTPLRFRNHNGCPHCIREMNNATFSAGVAGRTVIAEVVRTDARMLTVFREKGRLAARQYWIDNGGLTLLMHLMRYVLKGEVDPLHGHSVVALDEDVRTSLKETAGCAA